MKFYCYAFRDEKTESFTVPNFSQFQPELQQVNIERALKGCEDNQHLLRFKDYSLYLIGEYDDEKGLFFGHLDRICDFAVLCDSLLVPYYQKQNENVEKINKQVAEVLAKQMLEVKKMEEEN